MIPLPVVPKFKQILGECDSKEWGYKVKPGIWLVLRVLDMEGVDREFAEENGRFIADLHIVNCGDEDGELNREAIAKAYYYGTAHTMEEAKEATIGIPEEDAVGQLYEFGQREHYWEKVGNNALDLMHQGFLEAAWLADGLLY